MDREITAFIVNFDEQAPAEAPYYPLTAIPEGLGEPITPASLEAACLDAIGLEGAWPWQIEGGELGPGRDKKIPVIPVRHRWKVGAPIEFWKAGGVCRSFPAAYLAEYSFLEHDRGEAQRGPAPATGWRGLWQTWFPSSREPVIRPQDRAWKKPPPEYFRNNPSGNDDWLNRDG